jgi:hypothetical protein
VSGEIRPAQNEVDAQHTLKINGGTAITNLWVLGLQKLITPRGLAVVLKRLITRHSEGRFMGASSTSYPYIASHGPTWDLIVIALRENSRKKIRIIGMESLCNIFRSVDIEVISVAVQQFSFMCH